MKAIMRVELFGEDQRQYFKIYKSAFDDIIPGFWDATVGNIPSSSWIAEIIGTSDRYRYNRKFLKPKKRLSSRQF